VLSTAQLVLLFGHSALCLLYPSVITCHSERATTEILLLLLQGQQAAVKLSATYDAMLTLTQIICYCFEGKLRQWSSHRIVVRHAAVATLLVMLVLVGDC
jgi:hypothetical protein